METYDTSSKSSAINYRIAIMYDRAVSILRNPEDKDLEPLDRAKMIAIRYLVSSLPFVSASCCHVNEQQGCKDARLLHLIVHLTWLLEGVCAAGGGPGRHNRDQQLRRHVHSVVQCALCGRLAARDLMQWSGGDPANDLLRTVIHPRGLSTFTRGRGPRQKLVRATMWMQRAAAKVGKGYNVDVKGCGKSWAAAKVGKGYNVDAKGCGKRLRQELVRATVPTIRTDGSGYNVNGARYNMDSTGGRASLGCCAHPCRHWHVGGRTGGPAEPNQVVVWTVQEDKRLWEAVRTLAVTGT
eukprot:2621335-Pyramimonas_sp.AAC.3